MEDTEARRRKAQERHLSRKRIAKLKKQTIDRAILMGMRAEPNQLGESMRGMTGSGGWGWKMLYPQGTHWVGSYPDLYTCAYEYLRIMGLDKLLAGGNYLGKDNR